MTKALVSSWIPGAPVRIRVLVMAVAAAGPACVPGVARAEDATAKAAAKERLEKGADLLVTHAYSSALQEFEDAYRLFPSPKIFFDIGLADVGLDRNPDALRAFQRFLVEATDASPETVARAKAQIQGLLPRVAIVDIVCRTAGKEILVDNRSVGQAPLSGPVYLEPGRHELTARAGGNDPPVATTFTVAGGARVTVSVPDTAPAALPGTVLAVAAPPAASGPPTLVDSPGSSEHETGERPLYKRPWFWAAAAGVVAVVGVTLLLTVGRSASDPTPSLGHMDLPGAP